MESCDTSLGLLDGTASLKAVGTLRWKDGNANPVPAMKLSIIVATRNRAQAIRQCLDSVAAALAKAGLSDAEIVVVDNGSTDDTAAVLEAWSSASAFPLQRLFEAKANVSAARNRAMGTARGEIFAFTDDDCRLHKDHVSDLLRHDAADTDLVLRGGRVDLGDPADLPLTINTRPERGRWSRQMNSARYHNVADDIAGCNMTMRRALFERLGPFDVNFGPGSPIGASEDSDYNLRAYLAGATLEYVPDMAVSHYHGRKTGAAGNELLRRYMTGNGALYAKYGFKDPNLCRPLLWDIKHALKELASGSNTFLPIINFSHRDKVICAIRGAARYNFIRVHDAKSFGKP